MTRRISLPDYYICEELFGQNARAISARGRDRRAATSVVVKALRAPAWFTTDEARQFQAREIETAERLAGVHNAHLVPIEEVGEVEDGVYMARLFVPGLSLAASRRLRGLLPFHEAARVARQVGEALDALAAAGLRHGALTGHNVLLGDDHIVRLTDARVIGEGFAFSVAEAACRFARQAAPAADIRALAALIFEALSGFTVSDDSEAARHAYHLPIAARETF